MSDAIAPAAAPAAAPAPTSAPTAAPSSAGSPPAPPSGAQSPPEQAAPPAREPIKWKTKIALDDIGEREVEVDVDPFLREYKRKVKADGREFEVPVEEAFKSYERVRSSMARFDEAAKMRKEAEAIKTQFTEREQKIRAALTDPKQALAIVKRTLGEDAFMSAIVAEVRQRLEYEQLPPEQRQVRDQMTQAERKAQEREAALAKRARELEQREQQLRQAEEQRIDAAARQREAQIIAEWVPMLEAAGLPAKVKGEPNRYLIERVAQTVQRAKRAGMPLTVQEAIAEVRAEYEAMVGQDVERRQQQALEAAAGQPGRGEPIIPQAGPRPPSRKSYTSAEDFERELMGSWQRRR